MRAILIAGLIVGCGAGVQTSAVSLSDPPLIDGCETNLDAGVVCDPCPGSPSQTQVDYTNQACSTCPLLPDGGNYSTFRACDCPADAPGPRSAIVWRSCPPLPPGIIANNPETTCATIRQLYQHACGI